MIVNKTSKDLIIDKMIIKSKSTDFICIKAE